MIEQLILVLLTVVAVIHTLCIAQINKRLSHVEQRLRLTVGLRGD